MQTDDAHCGPAVAASDLAAGSEPTLVRPPARPKIISAIIVDLLPSMRI
jgi:hypothetical protein